MTDFPKATKHIYPNGVQVQWGGTRRTVQPYYLDRWEQTPVIMQRGGNPCVLHNKPQRWVEGWDKDRDFWLIHASSSMHQGHYIWLPTDCPKDEEYIRSWGGLENARAIFNLTLKLIRDQKQKGVRWINYTGRSRGLGRACLLFTHVENADADETEKTGATDVVTPNNLPIMLDYWKKSKRVVAQSGNVRAVLEPMSSAVEFFIFPTDGNRTHAHDLAAVIMALMGYVAEPFRSKVGHKLTPNFHCNLNFTKGDLEWGFMNFDCHPEGVEQRQQFVTGGAVIDHPWTPEDTMDFIGLK